MIRRNALDRLQAALDRHAAVSLREEVSAEHETVETAQHTGDFVRETR